MKKSNCSKTSNSVLLPSLAYAKGYSRKSSSDTTAFLTIICPAVKQHELGTSVADISRKLGIAEQTFYRWKKLYGGLEASEVRELKQLREENAKLKKLVADLSLDKVILQDIASKMYGPPRDCNNPRLGVARQVCINVSGLLVGDNGPGHDGDPRAVGSISWFGL